VYAATQIHADDLADEQDDHDGPRQDASTIGPTCASGSPGERNALLQERIPPHEKLGAALFLLRYVFPACRAGWSRLLEAAVDVDTA